MQKYRIARLTLIHNGAVGVHDVVIGWVGMIAIIHEDGHVVILESLVCFEVGNHVFDIIVAAGEFTLLADVVDSDHYGSFCAVWVGVVDDFEGLVDVDVAAACELWDLVESFIQEVLPHGS